MDIGSVVATLGAVALGVVLSEVKSVLDERRQEHREDRRQQRQAQLEALKQTRRMLNAQVDELQAIARGSAEDAEAAAKRRDSQEDADMHLIGDDDVAIEYWALVSHLSHRAGLGLRVSEDIVRSAATMLRVSQALTRQEERVRSGKSLARLSDPTVAKLQDAQAIADSLLHFDIPPSPWGRAARVLMDVLAWRTSRRRRARSSDRIRQPADTTRA